MSTNASPAAQGAADIEQQQGGPAALVCLITVGLLLGLTANVVKLAVAGGWQPLPLLFWSTALAGLVLLVAALATGQRPGFSRRHLAYYLICGFFSIAAPNAIGFSAVRHVGAAFVALSLAFPPLLTYLLALPLGLERFRPARAAGVIAGLAGALLLALSKAGEPGAPLFWIFLTLAAPLFIAAGNIYRTLHWPAGATPLSLAPGMLLGGALLLAPFSGGDGTVLPVANGAFCFLPLQVFVFSATYALYFVLQKLAGPVYLSQIGAVGALAGAGIATFLLRESPPALMVPATIAILVGVLLVNRRRR
jgi:drug/metabolite transporter (DMT)-like permease